MDIYIYIYIIPEQSTPRVIPLTQSPPLYSPANDYLVNSLPRPLSSTPFYSLTALAYSYYTPLYISKDSI